MVGARTFFIMFERLNGEENIGPMVKPPRKLQSDSEHIHRAIFVREGQLKSEWPGAIVHYELMDQEPRATLWAEVGGRTVRKEFFESTYSADVQRFFEEYIRAARECENVAVLYPGQSFPEDYVLRKVGQIYERARLAGVDGELAVHGYLYDLEGASREIV